MSSPAHVTRVLPARRAARKAEANFARQLTSSDEEDDRGARSKTFGEHSQKKGTTTKNYGRGGKRHAVEQRKESTHSTKPISPKTTDKTPGKRRRLSSSLSDLSSDPDSDSSKSLSSPSRHATKVRKSASSNLPKASRSNLSKGTSSSLPMATSGFPKAAPSTPFKGAPSRFPQTIQSSPTNSSPKKPRTDEEIWDIKRCDSFVFILVDEHGKVVREGEGADSDDEDVHERMWWPGKVNDTSPLNVDLYGSIASRPLGDVTILSPSPQTIQPMTTALQRLRFNASNFIIAQPRLSRKGTHSSPKKKRKRDNSNVREQWQAAVDEMMAEYDEENDGLPSVGLAFSVGGGGNKQKEKNSVSDEEDKEVPGLNDDSESCPEEDQHLDSLVFARDARSSLQYWPAKVEMYIPPEKKGQKPRFLVKYMDSTRRQIPRGWFYTFDDPGFATCQVGRFESDDEDMDDRNSKDEFPPGRARSPSPVPAEAVPSATQFIRLPLRVQFAYVKPVLTAILNADYAPATTRRNAFFDKKKNSLMDVITPGAIVSEREVMKMEEYLTEWVLRVSQRARIGKVDNRGNKKVDSRLAGVDHRFERSSPPVTESARAPSSSPAQIPPSSFSAVGENNSQSPPASPCVEQGDPDEHALSNENGKLIDAKTDTVATLISDLQHDFHQLPRQRGCAAYEALPGIKKIEYVLQVLQPEAIIQLILWRDGKRTSLELLSPEEEERLHTIGVQLSLERDWVKDIQQWRDTKVRNIQKHQGKGKSVAVPTTPAAKRGTRSRPQKA